MECSIQRGKAELNRTFHLSPNENSCTIARIKSIDYFFYNINLDFCNSLKEIISTIPRKKAFIILIFVLDNTKGRFLLFIKFIRLIIQM